jgi:hypothetical protein
MQIPRARTANDVILVDGMRSGPFRSYEAEVLGIPLRCESADVRLLGFAESYVYAGGGGHQQRRSLILATA